MSTLPNEAALPEQAPHTLGEKIAQVHQQQVLLANMRRSGDPQAINQAEALAEQYHVRDMGDLAKDVYRSAAHTTSPPGLGWIRASEHPELVRERLGVHWSNQQIHEYLQPDNSDFRAEIYLPDPSVYGPDVKPVIATKGSNGPVAIPNGEGGFTQRPSALEDWVENARQGMGLESDHADRAMTLATDFQRDFHKPFENVGHSKGAVGASASAELTGMPAYIFNGAGLHPNTVSRYAEQHHLKVYNVAQSIHSYHVKGEFLTDSQVGIHGMDAITRAQLGTAAQQLSELSQLTDVRALARGHLAQALPYDPKMQKDALGLVDYLSSHSGSEALKGVPLSAGVRQIELPAMMRDAHGQLASRPAQPSLGQIGADAGPLMHVVSGALAGGIAGKRAGDLVAFGGRGVEQGAQWVGANAQKGLQIYGYVVNEGVQGGGRLAAASIHFGGAAVADMRLVQGHAEALLDRGKAAAAQWDNAVKGAVWRAESHLPFLGGLRDMADRHDRTTATYVGATQAQAATSIGDAHRDASTIRHVAHRGAEVVVHTANAAGQGFEHGARSAGSVVNDGYRAAGAGVRSVTDRVPEAGAVLGGAAGLGSTATLEYATGAPWNIMQTGNVLTYGKQATLEAAERHGQQEVMIPSLDARTRQMEGKAIELMQRLEKSPPEHHAGPVTPGENPGAFLQKMLDSAKSGDWAAFRNDTQTLANMQPGRDMHTHAVAAVDMQQQHAAHQQTMQQQALAQQQAATQQQAAAHGMSR